MKLRPFTRRVAAFAAAIAILFAFLPATAPARAVSGVSRITVTPYGDPQSSRGFTWYTESGITGSDLQIVPGPGGETLSFSGYSGISGNAASQRWHKAHATGLSAGTAYAFRVGDAATGTWSPWGSFKTAAPGGFTFIALTDTQAASQRDANISANTLAVALTLAPEAAFVVHSGDVVDAGLDESLWTMTLDAAQSSLIHTTLVPAAGNHERSGEAFFQHFNLDVPAGSQTTTGAYYSFTWGPVHFVTLNTNEASGPITNISEHQLDWLKTDIAAARQKGAVRVVVNIHKGMYSLGAYATDSGVTGKAGLRTALSPILEELGVDLVLQGHDHFPSRTYPLRGGQPARLGVTYLNTNTAGVKAYKLNADVSKSYLDRFAFISATTPSYTRYQNFAVITVDNRGNITGAVYEIDQKLDAQKPYLVDSFDLPTPANRLTALPFDDIGADESFTSAVEAVYAAGIMQGVSDTEFRPDSAMDRATLVTLLYRLAGNPKAPGGAAFADVPPGQWYSTAVAWAAGHGYVNGYGNGIFGPKDTITRQQLAAVLHRYAVMMERAAAAADISGFNDGQAVSAYAREAMGWAYSTGVLSVKPANRLEPSGKVSRAEAAVAMAAMLRLMR